jgi:diguanylate cyclase (GGDEF)-like protein/PAS domain S-box-containing protein
MGDRGMQMSNTRIGAFCTKWLGDWGGILTALFMLFGAVYVFYLFFSWGGVEAKPLISNLATIIIYAGPLIMAARVSRNPGISPRVRRGWAFIALAQLSFIVGTAQWMYFENYLGEQPFPSWADAGYLCFYPLMLMGMLSLVAKMTSAEERLNFALDASVILLGGGMVLWYFLLRPIAQSHDGNTLKTVLSLAYPIADLVLLLGISSLLLRRTAFSSRGVINLLLLGVVVNFVADFVFGYQSLAGTYETGTPVDALFTLANVPVMIAAHMRQVRVSNGEYESELGQATVSRFFWVPYIAVAAVYLVLMKVALERDTEVLVYAIVAAGCVTALVIFRQFLFLRENIKTNAALTELQERIHGIVSASTDAIALADLAGPIQEVNDSFLRLTGRRRDEIVGKMSYLDFVAEDYLEFSVTPDMVIDTGRPLEYERELVKKDGSIRNISTTLYTVNGAQGLPAAMAVVVRDITDRRSLESQLTRQALHDPLTGLANRVLLADRTKIALSRSIRHRSRIALLYLDLDNFKTVNDTLGHAAGDDLLATVATRVQACLRSTDTAARIGGDEFAVLIDDLGETNDHTKIADRILEALRKPIQVSGREAYVGVSIGIALGTGHDDHEDLIRNADVAMYTAKRGGKNRYAVYQEAMHTALVRRAQLETELRTAIEQRQFEVHYQPIVDLSHRSLVAVEALVRWNHPRKINVGPAEFIPIAEELDLIGELGQFVLNQSCAQVAQWQREMPDDNSFALAVNISCRQLADPAFPQMVKDACDRALFSPAALILEITESTMLHNSEDTIRQLNEIRSLGTRLAVDDFGTGYSSLSYLHKYPIDVLKIDRAFVEMVNKGSEAAAMAKAIISMSETLRFTTIAEGIETVEQSEKLLELGCSYGQGYYYSRPKTALEMHEYLQQQFVQKTIRLSRALPKSSHSAGGIQTVAF